MSLECLFEVFSSIRTLREEEREALSAVVEERKLKRKQYLLQAGDVCRHYAFVISGCLRMYYTDSDGKEHCVLFATEGHWLADLSGLHQKHPSHFHIDALEPSTVLLIRREDLWGLWNKYHIFDRYFRVITEDAYSDLQMRFVLNNSVHGEERYLMFTKQFPHLVSRLSAVQIASYLGITPEFLSKIKSRILRSAE